MDESFPNAEHAFRDAFNQPDPAPKLLELIRADPKLETITDLVSVYTRLAGESPTQIDKLARVLVKLHDSKEIINTYDSFGNPAKEDIDGILDSELAEFHGGSLVVAESTVVSPSNDFLVASLLSAVSMKYRLCDCSAQSGVIVLGLHVLDQAYADDAPPPAEREIFVIGACLQLLVSGSYLYGPTGTDVGQEDVLKALQHIEANRIVQDRNGQRLLELTIQHAKEGFKNDVEDAWNILFPLGH